MRIRKSALRKTSIRQKSVGIRRVCVNLLFLAGFLAPSAETAHGAAAKEVNVFGWPLVELEGSRPPQELTNEPVLGRLLCPPLSRVDLAEKSSDPLLISHARAKPISADGTVWTYEMRTGIHWWNGSEVTAADLAKYLKQRLAAIVETRGGGLWNLPEHEFQVRDRYHLDVTWAKKPDFGPYVTNGAMLWRKAGKQSAGNLGYECAGLYIPKRQGDRLALRPAPGYQWSRPPLVLHARSRKPKSASSGRWVHFQRAQAFAGDPTRRKSDEAASCRYHIDLPELSVVSWNLQQGPTADPRMRKLLTRLTPRRALRKGGTAQLSEVVSAPIPRLHPGYADDATPRPFDMKEVSEALDRLKYRREKPSSPRQTPEGEVFSLTILRPDRSTGLVEKVLSDAFSSVGIRVEFIEEMRSLERVDGVLTGVTLDSFRADFLSNLHSDISAPPPFWPVKDAELDRHLVSYARALTTRKPDFSQLTAVHQKLYELEPFTTLLQHKACIDHGSGIRPQRGSPTAADPDWFRWLVL